ncbi:MAG TPA: carnitine dehydratase [Gammaproteobacteria bacterium]|nr:carnitine dehydratase [Gammaproteobacteria bacterium]|tara:strand:- start:3942 stop:5066 length:1125 start_codon:yes stop_codon:yes gene_type:complete
MSDLDGILVVSIEQAVAAPYVSSRLADAGARVIKIERPEGDMARYYDDFVNGESAYFVWLNRGKESICLDLKDDGDQQLLLNMVDKADVFIQNLAPGAAERLGLGSDTLRERNPALITVSISGYGDEGPYQYQKAYDLLVQAETGLVEITGNEAGRARVGVSVCDISSGMTAFQGVLQALIGRSKTGKGRHVSVSMYHALGDWMNVPYIQYAYGNHLPERLGLNHPTVAPYGAYRCGDDKDVLISIQSQREWRQLCEDVLDDASLADREGYAENLDRVSNRESLREIIESVFGTMTRDAVIERLEKGRIAYGRVNTLDDLASHPQNRYIEVSTPSGKANLFSPGLTHDGEVLAAEKIPSLDEHGAALRAEFSDE